MRTASCESQTTSLDVFPGVIDSKNRKIFIMKQEMLINVAQPEECRIAIVEDGQLEELYVERSSQDNYVGNIYKGKIVNLEPSIQAAFVDFGVGRNGFLHISDVESQYFRQGGFDPDKLIQPDGTQGTAQAERQSFRRRRFLRNGEQQWRRDGQPRRRRAGHGLASGLESSRPFRISFVAATRCWSK